MNLRILKKKDGTEVLQYEQLGRIISAMVGQPIVRQDSEWIDVPIVEEKENE